MGRSGRACNHQTRVEVRGGQRRVAGEEEWEGDRSTHEQVKLNCRWDALIIMRKRKIRMRRKRDCLDTL